MSAWMPPARVGEYRLREQLGQGGMGVVFVADDEVLHRPVAVKFLSPALAERPASRERFLTEARAAARIQHPCVAQVYRVGEHQGVPYMVSELVRGHPLDELDPPLPWREVARYGRALARGLDAAHACGVLHRDLKPANAIATDDGHVKLIDFGLAKLAAPERTFDVPPEPSDQALTRAGTVMGTPHYMSPEAWRGEPATERSDLYSLGALLYELATGRPPHGGVSADDLASVVGVREPRPLLELLGDDAATELADLIDRCLRIAPDARPASAKEVADALERIEGPRAADPRAQVIADTLTADGCVVVHAADAATAAAFCRREVLPIVSRQTGLGILDVALDDDPTRLTRPRPPRNAQSDATRTDVALFESRDEPDPEPTDRVVLLEGFDGGAAPEIVEAVTELLDGKTLLVIPVATETLSSIAGLSGPGPRLLAAALPIEERWASRRGWLAVSAAVAVAFAAVGLAFAVAGDEDPRSLRIAEIERVTFDDGCEEFPSIHPDGGRVYFDAQYGDGYAIFSRDLSSGKTERLTESGEGWEFAPALSPDGRQLAFLRRVEGVSTAILMPIGGRERPIGVGRLRPSWTPDGRAVWFGDGRRPSRFDVETGTVTRSVDAPAATILMHLKERSDGRIVAIPFAEDVATVGQGLVTYAPGGETPEWVWRGELLEVLAIAPDGDVVVSRRTESEAVELLHVSVDGGEPRTVTPGGIAARVGLAIAGDLAVWSDCAIEQRLATLAMGAGGSRHVVPLSTGDWSEYEPAAIPGTSRLVALSMRSGRPRIWEIDRDAKSSARMLDTRDLEPTSLAVSPDGSTIAFGTESEGLFVMPRDGSSAPRRFASGPDDYYPTFSADGRSILYQTKVDEQKERIAIMDVESGEPRILSDDTAAEPAVSPDGRWYAFVLQTDPERDLGVVVLYDPTSGTHEPLARSIEPGWYHNLRFSPDGGRLLFLEAGTKLYEVDLETREIVTRHDFGSRQFMGVTYLGTDVVVGAMRWSGDLWRGRIEVL